jgi:hypothetical protein
MFKDYFSQDLKEGEEVIRIVRKHWASFVWPVTKTFLILIIPFLLSAFLFSNYIGIIIFFVWVSIGFGYGLYQWICWYFDHFIITNLRIVNVDQKTLFARLVSETGLINIQDVTYEINGFLASLFNYGTVKVMTASNNNTLEMKAIERPKEVQEIIMDLHRQSKKDLSAQELVEFLEQNKGEIIKNKSKLEEQPDDFNIKKIKLDE